MPNIETRFENLSLLGDKMISPDPLPPPQHGRTPLSSACSNGQERVAGVLLEHGADPNCSDLVSQISSVIE
jgi:ankyrin repeat protein